MRAFLAILSSLLLSASASPMDCLAHVGLSRQAAAPARTRQPSRDANWGTVRAAAHRAVCPDADRPNRANAASPPLPPAPPAAKTPPPPRMLGFGLALMAATTIATAEPAKAAERDTPWGDPVLDAPTTCDKPVAPVMSIEGHAATIRGAEGRLCEIRLAPTPAGEPFDRSERVVLKAPLLRPLLLGTKPITVVFSYHAEKREGWAKGRLAAQINGDGLLYDRLGGDGSPGEVRIPLSPADILMAGALNIEFLLQGEAQNHGSAILALDAITINGE